MNVQAFLQQQTAVSFTRPIWFTVLPQEPEEPPTSGLRSTMQRATRQVGLFKKQTGSMGMFGLVTLVVEPLVDTHFILFENGVAADRLPREVVPAVLEGIWLAAQAAKLPASGHETAVVGFRVTVIDAVYHEVDSNRQSFVFAARLALQQAFAAAGLQPWTGTLTREPPVLNDQPLSDRVAAYRQQFVKLVDGVKTAVSHYLIAEADFQEEADGLFVQQPGDIAHVVQVVARWHGHLRLRLGVLVPAAGQLITGQTTMTELVDMFYGGIYWVLLPNDDSAPWPLDLDADPAVTATSVVTALAAAWPPFWKAWPSIAAIFQAAESGLLTLGDTRTAALLHVVGQTQAALTLLDDRIAAYEAQGEYLYFRNRLLVLRDKIKG